MKTSLILLSLLFVTNAHAGWWPWGGDEAPACPANYQASPTLSEMKAAVPRDLLLDWQTSILSQSPPQLAAANEALLLNTACLPLGDDRGRIPTIDEDLAVAMVNSIGLHPVVADAESKRYNKHEGIEIGFCFGRATYTHLMLLHLGVLKDSIKKVWAVGNLNSDNLVWQFHVATIVRSEVPGQWWVLDSYWGEPLELQTWVHKMGELDPGGQMKITITDPEKFSVQIGGYDRVQLGLDLATDQDWYAGYFGDLMKWFASKPDVTRLGLPEPAHLRR